MRRLAASLLAGLMVIGCSTAATPTPTAPPTAVPTASPAPTPSPEPTIDPLITSIQDAALATIDNETVSIDFNLAFNGNSTIADGEAFSGSGAAAFTEPRRLVMTADFTTLGLGEVRMIADDTDLYLRGTFLERLHVKRGKWLLVDLTSSDPRVVPFLGITTGQNDSSLVMYYLFGVKAPIGRLADEVVGGETLDHFQTVVDLDLAAEQAPEAARENLLDNIAGLRSGGVEREVQTEIWIGPDGLVRQVEYTYSVGRVAGGGTITAHYAFDAYGEPIELGIPRAADVVRLETLPR